MHVIYTFVSPPSDRGRPNSPDVEFPDVWKLTELVQSSTLGEDNKVRGIWSNRHRLLINCQHHLKYCVFYFYQNLLGRA